MSEINCNLKLKNIIYSIFNTNNGMRYIGKSINSFEKRYHNNILNTSNKILKNDILKYGKDAFEILILEAGYEEKFLLELESFYIKYFNTMYPYGYNLFYDTDPNNIYGNGKIYTVDRKNNEYLVYQKEPNDNNIAFYLHSGRGRKCLEETKNKISLANKGKKRTQESKDRISRSLAGKKQKQSLIDKRVEKLKIVKCISVLQIDPVTNKIINEFPSLMEAAKFLNLKSSSNLSSVCRGRQKTAGGFIFRYKY